MKAAAADVPAGPFFRIYCDVFTPNDPVISILTRIREAGRRVVLLSNIDPVRAAYIREHFPALGAFDGFVASSELRIMKPEPAIYLEAARLTGSVPEECVFIDDMEENVAAAAAVGFAGLRYAPGTDLSAELKKFGLAF
jgi:HAD superfamily hydrolase (TIGR01509 family)